MIDVLTKLKKLRGRSLGELRVRSAQAGHAAAERGGWSAQTRVPTDEAFFKLLNLTLIERAPVKNNDVQNGSATASAKSFLEHFRTRTAPQFFASFSDREQTLMELQQRSGGHAKARVVEQAERIIEGRFDLLGLRDLYFGNPVEWHLEPVAGKRTPLLHWSRIDYLNANVAGDKKITWELNRHQYFMTLGRAYWRTSDERSAETFVAHLSSWMDQNPPKLGINWASSLEVSFRSISWLWALYFFKDSPHLTGAVFIRAMKFLYLHARHLETYLSTYFSPNTHLTGEALGLFYLGTMWPEFHRAPHWRAIGEQILLAELDRHVRPDGVYFEQSSYYHRYTTEFYTHFLILAQANGHSLDGKVEKKLTALLDHLMYITRPDGHAPLFGDDDGGRLVMLDERAADDFRAALAIGAVLFGRSDYKYVAGEASEETLWLLSKAGLDAFDSLKAQPPVECSRQFADGGYYVMRDGWSADTNYLLMDCGPHGTLNGAHAHADALAFDLSARGRTLLVDPGTYTYTGAAEMRDRFRTSAAHNTLMIDGESSSVPGGPFRWEHVARSCQREWLSCNRFDLFEGEHDGYMRLAVPATHVRSVLFLKNDYWIVRDLVETGGAHHYDLRFHFAVDAHPALETEDSIDVVRECRRGLPGLEIFTFGNAGKWRREDGLISSCYGSYGVAPVYTFSATGDGPTEFITFLVPRGRHNGGTGSSKARAREIEAVGGRAFEIYDGDTHDVLLCGEAGGFVEVARLASDFQWTWARFACGTGAPNEFVLVGGQRLSFDGRDVLTAAKRVAYLIARRIGDEWHVETDSDDDLLFQLPGASRVVLNNSTRARA